MYSISMKKKSKSDTGIGNFVGNSILDESWPNAASAEEKQHVLGELFMSIVMADLTPEDEEDILQQLFNASTAGSHSKSPRSIETPDRPTSSQKHRTSHISQVDANMLATPKSSKPLKATDLASPQPAQATDTVTTTSKVTMTTGTNTPVIHTPESMEEVLNVLERVLTSLDRRISDSATVVKHVEQLISRHLREDETFLVARITAMWLAKQNHDAQEKKVTKMGPSQS